MECSLCSVALPDSSALESHFMGKKHQKVVAGMDLRTRQEGRAVYVSRLGPLRLPQLAEYFSAFGTVVNMGAGEDKNRPGRLHHAIVEFREEGAVRKVLLQSRSKGSKALGGHKVPVPGGEEKQDIQVFERQFRERRRSPSPAACPSLDTDIVKLRLAVISQPEEQIAELVRLCYLSHEEVEERVSICRHIQATFQHAGYPDCRVYPFGSSVSSLGFPGCDLDIFLELGSASKVSEHQRVRDSLHLLRTIPHCSRLHPILHARVPIIKFIHRTSGVHCDISFRNRSSVANSEFIRVCTDSDPRVRELLVTLRYFCKLHGLAGGGGGLRMSNYALTLLVILFLQLVEPPLLLPVVELQDLPGLARDEIAGWNCAFPRDPALLPPRPPCPHNSLQLLQQFLAWVTSLHWHQVVLCPFLGRVISRDSLQDPAFLAANFPSSQFFLGAEGLQLDKPLCLQDPFELSHNVCRNLPLKAVNNLRNYFVTAGQLVNRMVEGRDEELEADRDDPERSDLVPKTGVLSAGEDKSSPIGGIISIFEMTVDKVSEDEPVGLAELLKDCSEVAKEIFKFSTKLTLSTEYVDKCNSGGKKMSVLDCILEMVREILRDCLLLEERQEDTAGALGGDKSGKQDESSLEIPVNTIMVGERVNTDSSEAALEGSVENGEASGAVEGRVDDAEEGEGGAGKRSLGREEASKKPRLEGASEGSLQVCGGSWLVWQAVWACRRKLLALLDPEPGLGVVAVERAVTERLLEGGGRLAQPEVVFRVHLLPGPVEGGAVWLGLEQVYSRKKAFHSLQSWLLPFLTDTVARLAGERMAGQQEQ